MNKYDPSVKKQLANPKKVYCIDTGLVNSLSFRFSSNKGRLLENGVFLMLHKQGKELFYHKGQYECDFLVKEGMKNLSTLALFAYKSPTLLFTL